MTGGADPLNRVPLWEYSYNESSDRYKFIQKLNKVRDQFNMSDLDQRELYVLDNFYSYARGDRIMVALTNHGNTSGDVVVQVPNSPFSPNEEICDIFWEDDCFNVASDGSVYVYLSEGEPKVYVRRSDLPDFD